MGDLLNIVGVLHQVCSQLEYFASEDEEGRPPLESHLEEDTENLVTQMGWLLLEFVGAEVSRHFMQHGELPKEASWQDEVPTDTLEEILLLEDMIQRNRVQLGEE